MAGYTSRNSDNKRSDNFHVWTPPSCTSIGAVTLEVLELVQAAESDYNVLANLMSSGVASDLDLYDAAKKVDSNLGSYQVNVSKVKCEGISDYAEAASLYITNMQLTAIHIKKIYR